MHFDQIFKVGQIASWYLSGICFVNVEIAKWCVIILRSCFNAKSIRFLFDFKSVCFSVQRGINTLELFNSQSIFLPRNETNEPQPLLIVKMFQTFPSSVTSMERRLNKFSNVDVVVTQSFQKNLPGPILQIETLCRRSVTSGQSYKQFTLVNIIQFSNIWDIFHGPTPAVIIHLERKNLQRASNSDHWSKRGERWPLDQHQVHGKETSQIFVR